VQAHAHCTRSRKEVHTGMCGLTTRGQHPHSALWISGGPHGPADRLGRTTTPHRLTPPTTRDRACHLSFQHDDGFLECGTLRIPGVGLFCRMMAHGPSSCSDAWNPRQPGDHGRCIRASLCRGVPPVGRLRRSQRHTSEAMRQTVMVRDVIQGPWLSATPPERMNARRRAASCGLDMPHRMG
jgi:hypothetical protein